jgi:hypothetical protein
MSYDTVPLERFELSFHYHKEDEIVLSIRDASDRKLRIPRRSETLVFPFCLAISM